VFAGSIRAPITSVLIIMEMTGGYGLILPLMIANTIAYGLAHYLRPIPIYEALLQQDGIRLRSTAGMHVLENIPLEHVLEPGASSMVTFNEGTPAGELLGAKGQQEVYAVVEHASGRLVGIITDEDLNVLAAERSLENFLNASDMMRPPVAVRMRDDLRTALETMLAHGIRRIPVVDNDMCVTSSIDEKTLARAYLRGNTA
jgi:CIC family chloride channel protein